jgi:predicted nucleic acid-binding protein
VIYPDTGSLVKFYYPEPDSAVVIAAAGGQPLLFTDFHELEIMSALQAKVFRHEATVAQVTATLQQINADRNAGRLITTPVNWPDAFARAIDFTRLYAALSGTRALDTLHVAIAVQVAATELLTTDVRQRSLAATVGLPTLP